MVQLLYTHTADTPDNGVHSNVAGQAGKLQAAGLDAASVYTHIRVYGDGADQRQASAGFCVSGRRRDMDWRQCGALYRVLCRSGLDGGLRRRDYYCDD